MKQTARIMIIDDDITLLKTMESLLIEEEYVVSISKSGKQAICAIEKGNIPDLILLDISMPDMDGYETFKQIRNLRQDVPIIFLTGKEDTESELNGLRLGAIDYVTKPFVKDILITRIKNHLELSKVNRDVQTPKDDSPAVVFDADKSQKMEELLTESEFKVAKMIVLGYTNQEISQQLNYSYNYVKKIAYRIFDKLCINKRNEVRQFFVK